MKARQEIEMEAMRDALAEIARGRTDNGRPFAGEKSRTIARDLLFDMKIDWNQKPEKSA